MRTLSFFPSSAVLGVAGLLCPPVMTQSLFGPQQVISTAQVPNCVHASDLNSDGAIDIVAGGQGGAFVYENLGSMGFASPQVLTGSNLDPVVQIVTADLDDDGDLEVITASLGGLEFYDNLGGGFFGVKQVIINSSCTSVCAADIDGDGDQDVLATCFSSGVAWFANDGTGSFGTALTISTQSAITACAADMDGDGDVDALSTGSNGVLLYENLGAGSFGSPQQPNATISNGQRVLAADLDGDGDLEVVVDQYTELAYHENFGGWSFGPRHVISSSLGHTSDSIYAVDIDGDQDIDLITASNAWWEVSWYPNDGAGNFGGKQVITTNARNATCVYAADLDGDTDYDVLSASLGDWKLAAYENLTLTPSEVLGAGCAGLSLSGNPMRLNSSWDLQLDGVDASTLFAFFFVGGTALEPGVSLTATCTAYTASILQAFVQPVVAGSSTWSLAVPNNPALLGARLTVQAVARSPSPAAWNGRALSNGLRGTVGQ